MSVPTKSPSTPMLPNEMWGIDVNERIMDDGKIRVLAGAAENVYYRAMFFKAGGQLPQTHAHVFDHYAIVASGTVRLEIEGKDPVEVEAPGIGLIEHGIKHRFVALTDAVVICVHMTSADRPITMARGNPMPPGGKNG